jgi:hypothetical protein
MLNFGVQDFSVCFWMNAAFGEDYMVMGKSNGGIPNFINSNVLSCPAWNIQVENDGALLPLVVSRRGFMVFEHSLKCWQIICYK